MLKHHYWRQMYVTSERVGCHVDVTTRAPVDDVMLLTVHVAGGHCVRFVEVQIHRIVAFTVRLFQIVNLKIVKLYFFVSIIFT